MKKTLPLVIASLSCGMAFSQVASEGTYKGWKSIHLKNEFGSLQIVPEAGGRIMQYTFNGTDLFWENPALLGQSSPETGLDPDGKWMNYGGEKLWPAPQGWDNDQQWDGPPDPVLDGGVYASEIRDGKSVYLRSKVDPITGIRFERTIEMIPDTSGIAINATMTNESKKDIRWGIWSNAQLDASVNGERNDKFKVYCPINPDSRFAKGYGVLFGLVNNPQWQAGDGLMTIHYMHHVGKAVLDSPGGWLASVNGETGNVFVQRFDFEAEQEYPDHSSVAVWTQGLGSFYAWDKVNPMADDTTENPYLVESETLSPYADLKPGESYDYNYKWFTANIGGDYPITDVMGDLLVSELNISKDWIKARLGSFRKGEMQLKADGKTIASFEVSPTQPLVIDQPINTTNITLEFLK
ncbi:MAG: hypothetical protein DRP64_10430 [Verrucomicrobia bacterium]|nr:MAG: hypothetical protein DRP64_10430 [Verrucomicrobiota bacterium]